MIYLNIYVDNKCVAEIATQSVTFNGNRCSISIESDFHNSALKLTSMIPNASYSAVTKTMVVPTFRVKYLSNVNSDGKGEIRLIN